MQQQMYRGTVSQQQQSQPQQNQHQQLVQTQTSQGRVNQSQVRSQQNQHPTQSKQQSTTCITPTKATHDEMLAGLLYSNLCLAYLILNFLQFIFSPLTLII